MNDADTSSVYRMQCHALASIWVWPRDYTCVDLHLYDSCDNELKVTFGQYLHVGTTGVVSTHFSKSASQDVPRLRKYLDEMNTWDLWFGSTLLRGALVIAGEATAIIVPPTMTGEAWDIYGRAIVAGCPTGGSFTIWRTDEELFAQVASAGHYDGPTLPPQELIDESIENYLTATD